MGRRCARCNLVKNENDFAEPYPSRRRRRVAALIDYLEAHPCVDCGEADPVVLEFDHLGDKSFSVADGMKSRSWVAVLEEIEKCEVVCVNCHRRRTASRGAFRRVDFGAEPLAAPRLFGPWTRRTSRTILRGTRNATKQTLSGTEIVC